APRVRALLGRNLGVDGSGMECAGLLRAPANRAGLRPANSRGGRPHKRTLPEKALPQEIFHGNRANYPCTRSLSADPDPAHALPFPLHCNLHVTLADQTRKLLSPLDQ